MGKRKIFNLMNEINKDALTEESMNTGLLGEHIIIASYRKMSISKLEGLRTIINNIIRQKKEFKRIQEHKKVKSINLNVIE